MRDVQSISFQGGRKRGRGASSGVKLLEKPDSIGSGGGSSGVKCITDFLCGKVRNPGGQVIKNL